MAPSYSMPTAEEELKAVAKIDAALVSAGWSCEGRSVHLRQYPFTAKRKVLCVCYLCPEDKRIGTSNGRRVDRDGVLYPYQTVIFRFAMANHEYENRFLKLLEKDNMLTLQAIGLTPDADANAVLRMCL